MACLRIPHRWCCGSRFPASKADLPLFDHPDRLFGERPHANEPLRRNERLDNGVAALAVADGVLVILGLLEKAGLLELDDDGSPRLEAILSRVWPGFGRHPAVLVDDRHLLEAVPDAIWKSFGIVAASP